MLTHRLDMDLEGLGDCLRMFGALSRDSCQVADLISVILLQVFKGVCKVNRDVRTARKRTSGRSSRHDESREDREHFTMRMARSTTQVSARAGRGSGNVQQAAASPTEREIFVCSVSVV